MVERDRTDDIESAKIILERVVVAVPGDNIEGGVVLSCREESVVEFTVKLVLAFLLFVVESGNGGLEIACIGQTVGSNGAQLWELVVALV
jgi:hypothetical protein